MLITRTPFRISFFGGGSDIPIWFQERGGQVLSTTIDKYSYVIARDLPPYHDHTIKLSYSRLEQVQNIRDIEHPLIRVVLDDFERNNIEIHHDADLPGSSGLGTSSSFGVGLVHAISQLEGQELTRKELASRVITLERVVLKEAGGWQDQIAAAYGGLNHITFSTHGAFEVFPLEIDDHIRTGLLEQAMLFYLPTSRLSYEVSIAKKQHFSDREHAVLTFLAESVTEGIAQLRAGDFPGFGQLLHETWLRKRELTGVSNMEIDEIYQTGINAGAYGGKLLGAGGGGFICIFCNVAYQERVKNALSKLLYVPVKIDMKGSQVIFRGIDNHAKK